MNHRFPKPRENEPGYAGNPSCGWGDWIEHDGGDRPDFVLHTSNPRGRRADPVDYVGVGGLRGTGRNYAPDWTRIRWFRLRADHPHYGGEG